MSNQEEMVSVRVRGEVRHSYLEIVQMRRADFERLDRMLSTPRLPVCEDALAEIFDLIDWSEVSSIDNSSVKDFELVEPSSKRDA